MLEFRIFVGVLACEHLKLTGSQFAAHQATKQLSIVELLVIIIFQILVESIFLLKLLVDLISDLVKGVNLIALLIHKVFKAGHFWVKSFFINLVVDFLRSLLV